MDQKSDIRKACLKGLLEKHNLLILFLFGILLLIISMPTKDSYKQKKIEKEVADSKKEVDAIYERSIEKKLSCILEDVDGVGKNTVMITLKSTSEKVVEKDWEADEKRKKGQTVLFRTEGNEKPYVKKEITPRIEGIVVIADGGDNPCVIKNITEAVQALFDIDTHKIKVMKKNQKE